MATIHSKEKKETNMELEKRIFDLEVTLNMVREDLKVLYALRQKNIDVNTLFVIIDATMKSINETLQKHIDE
jgi:hypothetical protein